MNDPDCIGQTPLFYAVTHCQVYKRITDMSLFTHICIDPLPGLKLIFLIFCDLSLIHCQATELVPILLRAGSNVNAQRSNDGFSALHVAAMVGRLEVANLLLQVVIIMIDVDNLADVSVTSFCDD